MIVFFRVDSSYKIGAGHLKRCFNLAKIFKGHKIIFISKKFEGNLNHLIPKSKYSLIEIDPKEKISDIQKVEEIIKKFKQNKIMIVDSYHIDHKWEKKIKYLVNKLIVIDDIKRNHSADYLINPNWYFNKNNEYFKKYKNCKNLLFGPNYSLIESVKKKYKNPKDFTIFFGGSDDMGASFKVAKILSNLTSRRINIVLLNKKKIYIHKFKKEFFNNKKIKILINLRSIAKILQRTKIFIGSGGSTTWLRSYLSVNSIITDLSNDQKDFSIELHKAKCQSYLKIKHITNPLILKNTISKVSNKNKIIKRNFSNLVDGNGLKRIKILLNKKKRNVRIKKMGVQDSGFVYFLKLQKKVLNSAFSTKNILLNDHLNWFYKTCLDTKIYFYKICIDNVSIGFLRFNTIKNLSYIDIAIDENFVNFGYASKALNLGINKLKKKNIKIFIAKVKINNLASLNFFKKNKFKFFKSKNNFKELRLTI